MPIFTGVGPLNWDLWAVRVDDGPKGGRFPWLPPRSRLRPVFQATSVTPLAEKRAHDGVENLTRPWRRDNDLLPSDTLQDEDMEKDSDQAPADPAQRVLRFGANGVRTNSILNRLANLRSRNAPAAEMNEVWARLVTRFEAVVIDWSHQLSLRGAVAEERAFETLSKLFLKFGEYDLNKSFRAWLVTVHANGIKDELRRQKRRPADYPPGGDDHREAQEQLVDPRDQVPRPEAIFERLDEEIVWAIEEAKRQLHENSFHAFWRVVVDGADYDEVAAELGINPASARAQRRRFEVRVQEILRKRGLLPPNEAEAA